VNEEAINSCVVGVVNRSISALMCIGMSHESALKLLAIQAMIRLPDAAIEEVLQSIEGRGGG
jgi:hypothetical protein